jgi:hypothetical protein
MEMNSKTLDNFRADFNEAMKELEKKYGVSVDLGNMRYTNDFFRSKIEVTNIGQNGEDAEKAKFCMFCGKYGFSIDDYKKEFEHQGITFQLIGFDTRKRKRPCICKDLGSNREYVFTPETLWKLFGKV